MADNISVAGKTIATDEISGAHYQRAKLIHGADGTNAGDVAAANPLPVADDARATGGSSVKHLAAAGDTNATSLKTSAGTVYGATITSRAATPVYLKFYNKASAPTVGTDTPVLVLGCPATDAKSYPFPKGIEFSTGIAFGMTDDGPLDADTDVMTVDECVISIQYE
jgi:hypothetical protein